PLPASAFNAAGSVATSVFPSPVFISEILPLCSTIPPINCTSKCRIFRKRRPASRTKANAGTITGSSVRRNSSLYEASAGSLSFNCSRTCVFSAANRSFNCSSLSACVSASFALMESTSGWSFLRSRSCFVPINRATTRSITWATSMDGYSFPGGSKLCSRSHRPFHSALCQHFIVTCWMRARQDSPHLSSVLIWIYMIGLVAIYIAVIGAGLPGHSAMCWRVGWEKDGTELGPVIRTEEIRIVDGAINNKENPHLIEVFKFRRHEGIALHCVVGSGTHPLDRNIQRGVV